MVPCGSCALRYTRVVLSELFDVMFETYTFASHVRCLSCGFNFSVTCSNTYLHHNMSHGNVMQSSQTFSFLSLYHFVSTSVVMRSLDDFYVATAVPLDGLWPT